jgi:hypothetical protein
MRERIDIEAMERLAGKEGERTEYILVIMTPLSTPYCRKGRYRETRCPSTRRPLT